MRRAYAPGAEAGRAAILTGDEAHHLIRVLRLGVGDEVELFDGVGHAWTAKIVEIERHEVRVESEVNGRYTQEMRPSVTLLAAMPKGDRAEWLVEKAVEIGVERLVPLITHRTVVEPGAAKLERLRRRVIEACKQCGRNRLMEVGGLVSFAEVVEGYETSLRLLADQGGLPVSRWPRPGTREVVIAVGPEGGWEPEERLRAEELGWTIVGLGAYRLRVETAALVSAALTIQIVQNHSQDA
jgi:16S rRNA (uracil1498-N3)-methyltransferase